MFSSSDSSDENYGLGEYCEDCGTVHFNFRDDNMSDEDEEPDDPEMIIPPRYVNRRGQFDHRTAYQIIIRNDDFEGLQRHIIRLKKTRFDQNQVRQLLGEATEHGSMQMVEKILDSAPKGSIRRAVDLFEKEANSGGHSIWSPSRVYTRHPVQHAIQAQNLDLLKLLLDYGFTGIDVLRHDTLEKSSSDSLTVQLLSSANLEMVKLCFEYAKNEHLRDVLESTDQHLFTPFMYAVYLGDVQIVRFLSKYASKCMKVKGRGKRMPFIDVQMKTSEGRSIMGIAIQGAHSDIIEYLLESGLSKIHDKVLYGDTALQVALSTNVDSVIPVLCKYGGQLTDKIDSQGYSMDSWRKMRPDLKKYLSKGYASDWAMKGCKSYQSISIRKHSKKPKHSDEMEPWRKKLKKGDFVDCRGIANFNWYEAKVITPPVDVHNELEIVYTFFPEQPSEFISRDSERLEKRGTHKLTRGSGSKSPRAPDPSSKQEKQGSDEELKLDDEAKKDFEFRTKLGMGDLVDVQERNETWHRGEVRQVLSHNLEIQYLGYTSKWNEYIPRDSSKIAILGTHTDEDYVKKLDEKYLEPWREELKIGSELDCTGEYGWHPAVVVRVTTDKMVKVRAKDRPHVHHTYHIRSSLIDEKDTKIHMSFGMIKALNSGSMRDAWRRELKKNDEIDVLDTRGTWCLGRVIAIGRSICVHYVGYAQKYNEWIHRNSSRIAKKGTKCEKPLKPQNKKKKKLKSRKRKTHKKSKTGKSPKSKKKTNTAKKHKRHKFKSTKGSSK